MLQIFPVSTKFSHCVMYYIYIYVWIYENRVKDSRIVFWEIGQIVCINMAMWY